MWCSVDPIVLDHFALHIRGILVDVDLADVVSVISSGELDNAPAVSLGVGELLRLLVTWCEGSDAHAEDCEDRMRDHQDGGSSRGGVFAWEARFGDCLFFNEVFEAVFPVVFAVPVNWQPVLPYGLPERCDLTGNKYASRVISRSWFVCMRGASMQRWGRDAGV